MDNGRELYAWCVPRSAACVNGFHYIQTCLRVTGYSADAFELYLGIRSWHFELLSSICDENVAK